MYEIWLAMNIVWEIALGVLPLLLAAAAIWIVLMITAQRRQARPWGSALPQALLIGLAVAVLAVLALPGLTHSSLGELAYRVDWMFLLATALGLGAAAAVFVWPLMTMRGKGTH